MTERAAHLVDHVFPEVLVRQWVLSLPHRLAVRPRVGPRAVPDCRGCAVRAVLDSLRRGARQTGVPGGRGGAAAIIQRFGAALNLSVHVHALVLDGVYAEDHCGTLRFHVAAPSTDEEMDRLIETIDRRIQRRLARRGVANDLGGGGDADPWLKAEPVLANIAAASVQGRQTLGARAGSQAGSTGACDELPTRAPG